MKLIGAAVLGLLGAVVGFAVGMFVLVLATGTIRALIPGSSPILSAIVAYFIPTIVVTATAAGALLGIRVALRKPVPPPGFCRCGYDLTGNLSGVCPECGTAVPS